MESVTWFGYVLNDDLKVLLDCVFSPFCVTTCIYSLHVSFCIDLGSKTEWSPATVPRTPVQTFHVWGWDPTTQGSGAASQRPELPAQSPKRYGTSQQCLFYRLVC